MEGSESFILLFPYAIKLIAETPREKWHYTSAVPSLTRSTACGWQPPAPSLHHVYIFTHSLQQHHRRSGTRGVTKGTRRGCGITQLLWSGVNPASSEHAGHRANLALNFQGVFPEGRRVLGCPRLRPLAQHRPSSVGDEPPKFYFPGGGREGQGRWRKGKDLAHGGQTLPWGWGCPWASLCPPTASFSPPKCSWWQH